MDRTWCLLTLSVNLRNGDISIDQHPFLLLFFLLLLTSWFDKFTDCILLPILETKNVCNYPWKQFTKVSENSAFWKQTTPWLGSTEPVHHSNGIRLLLNSKEFFREVRYLEENKSIFATYAVYATWLLDTFWMSSGKLFCYTCNANMWTNSKKVVWLIE